MYSGSAMLTVLTQDLWSLAGIAFFVAPFVMIPAMIAAFFAAVCVEPTRWCDLPKGAYYGWLFGMPMALLLAAIAGVSDGLAQPLLQSLGSPRQDIVYGTALVICAAIVFVVQFRTAVWYFRWKRQDRLGWKLDDEPATPANRWYSFSLQKFLIAQFVFVAMFGFWIVGRRQEIERHYQRQQFISWQEDIRSRFEVVGWDVGYPLQPFALRSYSKVLAGFTDDTLDKLRPSDRLESIEIVSKRLTDAGLEKLTVHLGLKELQIESNQITDAGIAQLANLPALERVDLQCDGITGGTLAELQQVKSLKLVYISRPRIPRAAADAFRQARPDVQLTVFYPLEDYSPPKRSVGKPQD